MAVACTVAGQLVPVLIFDPRGHGYSCELQALPSAVPMHEWLLSSSSPQLVMSRDILRCLPFYTLISIADSTPPVSRPPLTSARSQPTLRAIPLSHHGGHSLH